MGQLYGTIYAPEPPVGSGRGRTSAGPPPWPGSFLYLILLSSLPPPSPWRIPLRNHLHGNPTSGSASRCRLSPSAPSEPPAGLAEAARWASPSASAGARRGPRMRISDKLPGDAGAARPRTPLGEPLFWGPGRRQLVPWEAVPRVGLWIWRPAGSEDTDPGAKGRPDCSWPVGQCYFRESLQLEGDGLAFAMLLAAEQSGRSSNEKDCGIDRRLLRAIGHQRKKRRGPV